MNLATSPEQAELQASARRFLENEVSRERLLAWDRTPEGYDAAFWRAVSELGWVGFSLPEAFAGGGASLLDAALILEEWGRAAAPACLHSAIVGGRALARLCGAATGSELAAVARGERQVTLAVYEHDTRREISRFRTWVENGKLHGEKWFVRQGVTADLLIVAALENGKPVLVLVPIGAKGVERRELGTFGGDRQSVLRFDGVPIERDSRLADGADARGALARVEQESVALALAEMVGGFTAVVEMTIAYVKERVQFNQPLGKFQAVQFRCADMATSLAGTRHLAFQAIWRLSEGLDATRELALARAFAGGAYKQATLDAHQLHGGAGYVVEHPLHRYSERAQSYAILFADEDQALEETADRLLGRTT
ncbi:MAG: acyl-CoA dehydrogenase family protein [Candidatus Binatia bacterium]